METTITAKTHKTSVYFVQDQNGKIHGVTYRPTDPYEGRRDSDQWALMQGLFIDNPSHDLWLGNVSCHLNTYYHGGIHTNKNLICKIIAKEAYIWDYSKPMGERKTETKQSKHFRKVKELYFNQNKK